MNVHYLFTVAHLSPFQMSCETLHTALPPSCMINEQDITLIPKIYLTHSQNACCLIETLGKCVLR